MARLFSMNEFNRVLDGDNLAAALAVDEVHEIIQRGGLARAGGTGDQHQAVGFAGQFVESFRQTEFLARLAMRSPQKRKLISGCPLRR